MVKRNHTAAFASARRSVTQTRVLVIGAGMAGLACARELKQRGYQVLVVEARHRVGGRLKGDALLTSVPAMGEVSEPAPTEGVVGKKKNYQRNSRSLDKPKKRSTGAKLNRRTAKKDLSEGSRNMGTSVPLDWTDHEHCIDLGGAFIHGIEANPVHALVTEMGLPVRPVSDCLLLDSSGWPVDAREDERIAALFNDCLDESFRRCQATAGEEEDDQVPISRLRKNRQQSFGDVFDQVCKEKGAHDQSPLFQWHKANLEVSCGASFHGLGLKWNEDEPYGYEGEHVALPTSWKPVMEELAQGLDIMYGAPVQKIHVVHPPPSADEPAEKGESVEPVDADNKDHGETVDRGESEPSRRRSLRRNGLCNSVRSGHNRNIVVDDSASLMPARKSRRLRGEAADLRRSDRSNKGVAFDRFTLNYFYSDLLGKNGAARRNKKHLSGGVKDNGPFHSLVQVTLRNGTVLQADAAVCTVPLGILKLPPSQGGILFEPPLPTPKIRAIERLGTGLLNKCALTFDHVFWQNSDFLGLAEEGNKSYLVVNSAVYAGKPMLLFLYGGDFAREIEEWTDDQIVRDCVRVLTRICGRRQVPAPLDYHVTRWGKEQFSRMAFTFIPPGVDGFAELHAMSQPIISSSGDAPVLMFAGEHTTPYHPSTIHGAFLSGIREAYRLDFSLDRDANDNLVFSHQELYQKTFSVNQCPTFQPLSLDTGTQSLPKAKAPGQAQRRNSHRRRGASAVIRLRHDHEQPISISTSRRTLSSKRSQMGLSSKLVSGAEQGKGGSQSETCPHLIKHDGKPGQLWQERIILRSLESYGMDSARMQMKSSPFGGYFANTSSMSKKLVKNVQRLLKLRSRTSTNWKWWVPNVVYAFEPPAVNNRAGSESAVNQRDTIKGGVPLVSGNLGSSHRLRSGRIVKPRDCLS